ncbi:MAG: MFS transporter [Roseiflexaceae bacterium]
MALMSLANRRSLRFLALSQAGLFAANGLTVPLMVNHFGALGAGPALVGLMFAASQLGSLVAPYLWGLRSDQIGRRRPIIFVTLIISSLALLTISLTKTVWVVMIAQLLLGIAGAGFNAGSLALAGDLIEDASSRGRVLGFFRTTGSLAFAITAVGGGFIADAFGLWAPILLASIMQALGCLATFGIQEVTCSAQEVAPDPLTPPIPPANSQFSRGATIAFFVVVFSWFYGMGAVAWQWPAFMKTLDYSQSSISALWALAALGEVPALTIAGLLADRWGRRPLLMAGLTGQGIIYMLYQVVAPTWGIVPLQMIRSLTFSSYETPALLVATEMGLRQRRGRLAGMYHTIAALGGVVGATIGGQLVAWQGYTFSFMVAGVWMMFVAWFIASRLPRQQPT